MEKFEVMARVEKKTGFLLAVFPYDIADHRGSCTVYDGQHSGADYQWVLQNTKPADEQQTKDIMSMLCNASYNDNEVRLIKQRNYTKYLDKFYESRKR